MVLFLSYRPDRCGDKERVVRANPPVSAGSLSAALKSSRGRNRGVSAGSLRSYLHASPQTPFRPDRPSAPSCCGFQCCRIGRIAWLMTSRRRAVVGVNPAVSAGSPMRCLKSIMRQKPRRLGRIAQKISTCGREHAVSAGSMSMYQREVGWFYLAVSAGSLCHATLPLDHAVSAGSLSFRQTSDYIRTSR